MFRGRWLGTTCSSLASARAECARAQLLYGSVVGAVKDAQGAAIPAATVVITNKDTNLTRETVTGAEREYTLANVLPGHYDVKVALTGFREFVQTNVPVTAGQISRVDVKLEIGALTETRYRRVGRTTSADRQVGSAYRVEVQGNHESSAESISGIIRR